MQKVLSKLHLLSLAGLFFLTSCSGVYEGSQEQKQDDFNVNKAATEKKWRDKTNDAVGFLSSTLPPDQAIVVGRLMLISGGKDLTQQAEFFFNYNRSLLNILVPSFLSASGSVSVMNHEGYFCAVLPSGKNTFSGFTSNRTVKWLSPEATELSFEAQGNGKITYIGDVVINFGIISSGFPGAPGSGRMQIVVQDSTGSAAKFFGEELRATQLFTSSLIKGGETFKVRTER
ncbi:MAG: hypothetical protein IAF08_14120 [Rhizobacter sp.]|nr:hypothetical protein [Chlorobiales bacterium]